MLTSLKKVPNEFPTGTGIVPYRIAIIGEAPGKQEVDQNKPFVGKSGQFLDALLTDAGIDRKLCYIGNTTQVRPADNDISLFDWNGSEIQEGLDQLRADITIFNPNLIILMGATPLRAAKGLDSYFDKKGKLKFKPFSIHDYRGSVFICDQQNSPFYGRKCIATYHPAYLARVYDDTALVRWDLKRARKEGTFPQLNDSGLVLDTAPVFETIITRLRLIREHGIPIALDIEGGVQQGIKCISISPDPKQAFIIPFVNKDGYSYWDEEQEDILLYELDLTMGATNVAKTLQSGMYDAFVMAYVWKILVRNIRDDTMYKHWELYCELEKSLGLQTSIHTEHAYYKGDIKAQDIQTFWAYCCKDSAITNEISHKLEPAIVGGSRDHYTFNINLINPFLFIELKGMRLDNKKRLDRIQELQQQAYFEQKGSGKYKKVTSWGVEQQKLEEMVGWQINVKSNDDKKQLLYDQLGLPIQWKDDKDGRRPTADYEAILTLAKQTENPILYQLIKVISIRTRISGLERCTPDEDGRCRSAMNPVGASTGRLSSSEAPTGNGTNLQNIPKEDRDIFIADEGFDFTQCDLEGADGWTVAAHCARLGDPTMLEDFLAGVKPAKIIALMAQGDADTINQTDRKTLKLLSKNINSDTDPENNYIYFSCKRIFHGTNYMMGAQTLSDQIFIDTEGNVRVTVQRASFLQSLMLKRYKGLERWWSWLEWELKTKGSLTCASGQKRLFFGRKNSHDTLKQMCAHEPQHNTTWITNTALLKLWNDPENRDGNRLKIFPCHQVHDALCAQWPQHLREWATKRMYHFFDTTVTIAGIRIKVPFEARFGNSWLDQPNSY